MGFRGIEGNLYQRNICKKTRVGVRHHIIYPHHSLYVPPQTRQAVCVASQISGANANCTPFAIKTVKGKAYGFNPSSSSFNKTYYESQYNRRASTTYLVWLLSPSLENLSHVAQGDFPNDLEAIIVAIRYFNFIWSSPSR